jgi:hypothetical protein
MASTTTTVPGAGPVVGSRSFLSKLRDGDEIARLITFVFAASVVLLTLLLVYELWQGSELARHKFGFRFLFTRVWDPLANEFGALPFSISLARCPLFTARWSPPRWPYSSQCPWGSARRFF